MNSLKFDDWEIILKQNIITHVAKTPPRVRIYYKGIPCFITRFEFQQGNPQPFIRLDLQSWVIGIFKTNVCWGDVYPDLSWYPSNSVDFIKEI